MGTPGQIARALRTLDEKKLIKRTQTQSSSFVKTKIRSFVRLTENYETTASEKLTPAQTRIIETLQEFGPTSLQLLIKTCGVQSSTVAALEKKGLLQRYSEKVRRDPLSETKLERHEVYTLTPAQQLVLDEISVKIDQRSYASLLLHGVTGSGKTEVYIRAMRAALDQGRSSMMLVPEIALTPVFSRRLRARFGDQVAIFHSSLQKGERFDEWTRVRNGEARVVIGTRSAVFAPVKNLGLIVVDEEHESSYRQQESPYYNASRRRDRARAKRIGHSRARFSNAFARDRFTTRAKASIILSLA